MNIKYSTTRSLHTIKYFYTILKKYNCKLEISPSNTVNDFPILSEEFMKILDIFHYYRLQFAWVENAILTYYKFTKINKILENLIASGVKEYVISRLCFFDMSIVMYRLLYRSCMVAFEISFSETRIILIQKLLLMKHLEFFYYYVDIYNLLWNYILFFFS